MGRVRFSDVVKRVNVFVDREHTDLLYYVGGEHIDSDAFMVRKNGLIKGATIGYKFHFGFQPGHILFMSRNPHLRKCSMVDFAGVCSDSTYVVETRDENVLQQRYLLIEMQSDRFWKWAEENKSGSVNYLINYCTLDSYEFDLPPIEEQRALAEKLWAANDLKEKYRHLLAATDEMLKAKFREMFPFDQMDWPLLGFDDFAIIDATMTTDYEKYADFPHIGIDSIESGTGELKGYRTVREDHVISGKYIFGPQHIIYSKIRPNMNKVALPNFEGLCSADSYPILVKFNCDRHFLAYVLRSPLFLDYIVPMSSRSNMPKVNREQISGFKMKLPPIELQREFVAIADAAEASKAELKKSITSIDAVIKGLING
ncbi:MAG: restriction endonuclease subunit S [Kiritimatiellae bacterium]|nr:restriction endonuclease subunit S [Kiritimatiellia bacterium]MBQ3342823.1 restriction endonuclease subunit S [Kiritimatiellia bacterium]